MKNANSNLTTSVALATITGDSRPEYQSAWNRYFPRVEALTMRTLRHLPHRREDAADAAQSAFISFWKATKGDGALKSLDQNSLWRLLATIAVRKARQVVRKEFAEKRGGGNVAPFSTLTESANQTVEELLGDVSTTDFDLAVEERLLLLPDDELRQIALLRLYNHTNAEIAQLIDCSERRIDRKLRVIKSHWNREPEGSDTGHPQ